MPMNNIKFGKLISTLRKEKNMTQKELAEKLNITDKAVSKWERNLSCPDVNTISKLADILDVSVEELIQSKNNSQENIGSLINLILKAVALAMGIALIILNVLNQIDVKSSIIMLSIALVCVAFYLFRNENKK